MAPPGKNYLFYTIEEKQCLRGDLPKKETRGGEVNILQVAPEEELFDQTYYTTESTVQPRKRVVV